MSSVKFREYNYINAINNPDRIINNRKSEYIQSDPNDPSFDFIPPLYFSSPCGYNTSSYDSDNRRIGPHTTKTIQNYKALQSNSKKKFNVDLGEIDYQQSEIKALKETIALLRKKEDIDKQEIKTHKKRIGDLKLQIHQLKEKNPQLPKDPPSELLPKDPPSELLPEVKKECVICEEFEADTAIIPCGHAQFCRHCVVKISECSICRQHKTGVLRVYL
jgi:hypothetical protein